MIQSPDLSVLIPFFNEAGNVHPVVDEVHEVLKGLSFEVICVNDCSADETATELAEVKAKYPETVLVLSHIERRGKSAALFTGLKSVRGSWVQLLDGDGQNPPGDIPKLYAHLKETGVELVGGERQKRQDSTAKLLGSRIGNGVRKRLLNDTANDTGCGLKAFTREAFLRLPYFDHIHRYLPALMIREGYQIAFLPVSHRAREAGVSKYTNFGRLKVSIADLRGVRWLNKRARLPGDVTEL